MKVLEKTGFVHIQCRNVSAVISSGQNSVKHQIFICYLFVLMLKCFA